ncbi:DVU0298 family protein [Humidesulfovibrio sp.]
MAHFRDLKRTLRDILTGQGWRVGLDGLAAVPARQLAGPLFSLLLDRDELVRWRAVEAFGRSIARLAESAGQGGGPGGGGMEAARVVLRQCLWRMNEESGGLGWGIPEALGESLARNRRLAGEFHRVLASYVRHETSGEGNYLEHAALRQGVFWGLGRLAQSFPELLAGEGAALLAGLADEDGANRGLAAWVVGLVGLDAARGGLAALADDATEVALFLDGELQRTTTGLLARQALARLDSAQIRPAQKDSAK